MPSWHTCHFVNLIAKGGWKLVPFFATNLNTSRHRLLPNVQVKNSIFWNKFKLNKPETAYVRSLYTNVALHFHSWIFYWLVFNTVLDWSFKAIVHDQRQRNQCLFETWLLWFSYTHMNYTCKVKAEYVIGLVAVTEYFSINLTILIGTALGDTILMAIFDP